MMAQKLSPDPRAVRRALARAGYRAPRAGRPSPAAVSWRWRYELGAVAGAVAGTTIFGRAYGPGWTIAAISGLVSLVGGWPVARRFLVARAWCVITPHRIRTGCAQAWIQSRSGRIPIVVRTTRQPFGERVLLWCPAGTGADDLRAASEILAAACWASDIHVSRDGRYAQLVVLDVLRYDHSCR